MDKTYAETQDARPFDWSLLLANPPERGTDEWWKAHDLAASWVTCACGNQCAIIPRSALHGDPHDDELRDLGLRFADDIYDADWARARTTLAAIEARSAVLIQQELAKLNP